MSAPESNGDPYRIMRDAAARVEMALANLLDDSPTLLLDDSADVIKAEVAALKAARTLAESRAKLAAPDMGGCVLDLSDLDDARQTREALHHMAVLCNQAGDHDGAARALRLRKAINHGVRRNCERRTGGAA